MRVLVAYNKYRQEIQGEQVAIDALVDLLNAKGHQVLELAQPTIGVESSILEKAQSAVNGVYSNSAFRIVDEAIKSFRPDVVHFHNLYPNLGTSAVAACEVNSVPKVISLHNFFLTCPIYKHFRNGSVCVECTPGNPVPCVSNNCRDNIAESIAYAVRSFANKRQGWLHRFDGYLVMSDFARGFLNERGVPVEKMHLVRNFIEPIDQSRNVASVSEQEPYVLFLGRITAEKGIGDLIAAAERQPETKFLVAGGQLDNSHVDWPANVEYLGALSPTDARALLDGAQCLLFASRWFEMCPMVLLEAMQAGVPIVATTVGGVPELVENNVRGLLYEPGDIDGLCTALDHMMHDSTLRSRLCDASREYVANEHSPDTHYTRLMQVYAQADA